MTIGVISDTVSKTILVEKLFVSPRLVILTNCTERKRERASAMPLSRVSGKVATKARNWCKRLENWKGPKVSAIDMYQGDHWTAILTLIRKAEAVGWETDLWVVSAGYGLVPAHAHLAPYAATFAGSHRDSVSAGTGDPPKEAARKWWRALSEWRGPVPGSARTLVDLAVSDPEASWLIMMSPTYLGAITNDLLEARDRLSDPDRLLLVAGNPGPAEGSLICQWVPALEASRGVLGGGCTSLNARIGAFLVTRFPPGQWSARLIQPQMNLWAAALPDLEKPSRRGMTDLEIQAYIRKERLANPQVSHSSLLRTLRDQGLACEQSRFRRLFQSLGTPA